MLLGGTCRAEYSLSGPTFEPSWYSVLKQPSQTLWICPARAVVMDCWCVAWGGVRRRGAYSVESPLASFVLRVADPMRTTPVAANTAVWRRTASRTRNALRGELLEGLPACTYTQFKSPVEVLVELWVAGYHLGYTCGMNIDRGCLRNDTWGEERDCGKWVETTTCWADS